jgi:pimeloyl-ACP methyl ester carboxylesterase
MPQPDLLTLALVALIGFLIAGALSPFEALGWWAGWYGQPLEQDTPESDDASLAISQEAQPQRFVVFLSGIHSVSDEVFAGRELALLERLDAKLPDTVIVEVFPYSVTNRALTGQRSFARFWRWALRRKLSGATLAGFLINLRNVWQVAVSADRRYGPIYNQGSADMLGRALRRHGYEVGSGVPITLIGYSGGGQIAMGAAPYLKEAIGAPVQVISLGGVLSADPGLLSLDKLYHLHGTRDMVQRLGPIFFPGRWRLLPHSAWNRAKEEGIVELIDLGPVKHTGRGGYLDDKSLRPDGKSFLEATVEAIVKAIQAAPHPRAASGEPQA